MNLLILLICLTQHVSGEIACAVIEVVDVEYIKTERTTEE